MIENLYSLFLDSSESLRDLYDHLQVKNSFPLSIYDLEMSHS